MVALIRLHRLLAGLSLILLSTLHAGLIAQEYARYVTVIVMFALLLNMTEGIIVLLAFFGAPRKLDPVYPLTVIILSTISFKALPSGDILIPLITLAIMFMFGYLAPVGATEPEASAEKSDKT